MSCWFERQNAIGKDPLEVLTAMLARGMEFMFVVAVGVVILGVGPDIQAIQSSDGDIKAPSRHMTQAYRPAGHQSAG